MVTSQLRSLRHVRSISSPTLPPHDRRKKLRPSLNQSGVSIEPFRERQSLFAGVHHWELRNFVIGRIDCIREQKRKRILESPRPRGLVMHAEFFLHPHEIFTKPVTFLLKHRAKANRLTYMPRALEIADVEIQLAA